MDRLQIRQRDWHDKNLYLYVDANTIPNAAKLALRLEVQLTDFVKANILDSCAGYSFTSLTGPD